MSKRLISACILFILVLSCAFSTAADEAAESTALSIKTAEEFMTFSENCRLDSYSQGLVVSLDADIDLSGTEFTGIPIFCGEFNGNGYTISDIDIQSHGSVIGLFRYLTETALITDLNVSGTIAPQGTAATVGGIAGSNAGTITGCTFSGILSGTDEIGGIAGINSVTGYVEKCTASGSISGNHFVGGIVGANNGIIQSCTNQAQINTDAKQNNVNLSDITIDTLTGSESANTVTDIGGITGTNSGHIQNCKNEANIGYNHIGYNIGGIAGSQIGYLGDCENSGTISGRKEVGGIIGQLEPAIAVTYSTDTLQILEGQLNTLSSLSSSISANLDAAASGIRGQIVTIQGEIESAKNAFSELSPDPEAEDPVPDIQDTTAVIDDLKETLSSINDSLSSILNYTENAGWALNRDLQAMSDTIFSMQQTLGNASNTLGASVSDASDEDTDENLTAKVERCTNTGAVNADLNCGGIAGAICLENDLDPEDDIMLFGELSLNFAGTYRAVITDCHNTAPITAKKQYAGGITGLATLGLIRSCTNTGTLNCPNADYVGGIAGMSDGSIRNCSAKTQIQATDYAGGIAGEAYTVSDCRAMTSINAQENIGAIAGSAHELTQLTGNYYLAIPYDLGAIDGISYNAVAQRLSQEDFFALENIPDFFRSYQVTFAYEDGTETVITLNTGERLTNEHIPEITPKAGFECYWSGIEEELYFDTVVTAAYDAYQQVIQSTQLRDNGLPIILVSGSFADDTQLTIEQLATLPQEDALEGWTLSLPQDTQSTRYLPSETVNIDSVSVMVLGADGQWSPIEHTKDGSYLVFSMSSADTGFCILSAKQDHSLLYAAAGGTLLFTVILVIFIIVYRRKRAAKTTPATTDAP